MHSITENWKARVDIIKRGPNILGWKDTLSALDIRRTSGVNKQSFCVDDVIEVECPIESS